MRNTNKERYDEGSDFRLEEVLEELRIRVLKSTGTGGRRGGDRVHLYRTIRDFCCRLNVGVEEIAAAFEYLNGSALSPEQKRQILQELGGVDPELVQRSAPLQRILAFCRRFSDRAFREDDTYQART
jgi:hypothetical protein